MMLSEPFADGQSVIHRLDPRIRLAGASAFSIVVALLDRPASMGTALGIAVTLVLIGRLAFIPVAKRLALVFGFLVLLWLVLPLTSGGKPVGQLGPFVIGDRGLFLSASISVKSIAILLALMALVGTMTVATLGHTMGRLRIPPKIVFLLLMTYRYIHVINSEYRRLTAAIKIRGFQPKTGLHAYRTYAYLVGMLLVRAALRAERVHQAMVCRGFQGRFYAIGEFTLDAGSIAFGTAFSLLIASVAFLEWGRFL